MTAPERAHSGSEQANEQADLRVRLVDAIEDAANLWCPKCGRNATRSGCEPITATNSSTSTDLVLEILAVEGTPEAFADAVMAVVQPELDRISEDLTCAVKHELQARADLSEAEAKTRIHKRLIDAWRQRAEAAEAELAQLRAYHQQIGDQS